MWVESALNIMSEIVNYFRVHFYGLMGDRPTLDGVKFLAISVGDDAILNPPFIMEEVKGVVLTLMVIRAHVWIGSTSHFLSDIEISLRGN